MPSVPHPSVFVLDKHKKPLMPCSSARARELLRKGKAVVHRVRPFAIRLKDRAGGDTQPVRVCLDPGSKTTGLAIVREATALTPAPDPEEDGPVRHVLFKAELVHRGPVIRKQMEQRKGYRKGRRSRNLRHRAPRFDNRRPARGTLPPSLRHRVETVTSWVRRFVRWAPVTAISQELVRFDTQAMVRPGIEGAEYQQGTLAGYELREYLLEKWDRKCAYCDKEGVPLQVEHVRAKSKGGGSRPSDLAIACGPCNQKKGARPVAEFLARQPARLAKILAHITAPLSDAAAINATRWALRDTLATTGLPVETASGGRTKWNRSRLKVPKTHANDALCVGRVAAVAGWPMASLGIRCTGRGSYQRTNVTASGFPRGYLTRTKIVHGFRTGDLVVATVPKGKKMGTHTGRVAVRATGSFNVQTAVGVVQGLHHRHCRLRQRADGYGYGPVAALPVGVVPPWTEVRDIPASSSLHEVSW